MNLIEIYWIGKDVNDEYSKIEQHYLQLSNKYSKTIQKAVITREIIKKQSLGNKIEIQQSYNKALEKNIKNSYFKIALDPQGKDNSTEDFAKILQNRDKIQFFIGGAFGFNNNFKEQMNLKLHLSSLTMNHKIAKIVLIEQIYRGLSINNNHQYHK